MCTLSQNGQGDGQSFRHRDSNPGRSGEGRISEQIRLWRIEMNSEKNLRADFGGEFRHHMVFIIWVQQDTTLAAD